MIKTRFIFYFKFTNLIIKENHLISQIMFYHVSYRRFIPVNCMFSVTNC